VTGDLFLTQDLFGSGVLIFYPVSDPSRVASVLPSDRGATAIGRLPPVVLLRHPSRSAEARGGRRLVSIPGQSRVLAS
jgi:hypothetical protein